MKKCPNCGNILDSSFSFCPVCGCNLTEVEELVEPSEETRAVIGDDEATEEMIVPSDNSKATVGSGEEASRLPETAVNTNPGTDYGSEMAAQAAFESQGQKKKKKTGLIVGGVIAAIALIAILVLANRPKLVSIDAKYYGPTEKGTPINNSSDITVTGTYDNNTTKEITDWSVEETTIRPGFNDFTVTYEDKTAEVTVYSPLMSDHKYLVSVDEINDVLYVYNKKYVDGFTGFTKDPKVGGQYNYDGAKLKINVSYTKKSGSEYIAAEGSDVPDTMIVTILMRADDFGDNLDRIYSAGAAAFYTIDPDIKYDDAYEQIKQGIADAVSNGEGAIGTDEKKLDNLDLYTAMLLANGNLLIIYSFKTI